MVAVNELNDVVYSEVDWRTWLETKIIF